MPQENPTCHSLVPVREAVSALQGRGVQEKKKNCKDHISMTFQTSVLYVSWAWGPW